MFVLISFRIWVIHSHPHPHSYNVEQHETNTSFLWPMKQNCSVYKPFQYQSMHASIKELLPLDIICSTFIHVWVETLEIFSLSSWIIIHVVWKSNLKEMFRTYVSSNVKKQHMYSKGNVDMHCILILHIQ